MRILILRKTGDRANHQRLGNGKIGKVRKLPDGIYYEFWPVAELKGLTLNMVLTPERRLRDPR